MHHIAEPLLARTYDLLENAGFNPRRAPNFSRKRFDQLSYADLAEGAGVDRNWIAKFVTGAISEPGVTKVQGVHDFLVGRLARQQDAATVYPLPPQSLGDSGNG